MCERCNCYFSFWAIFCTFTPLAARKIKISVKKNTWRYYHFIQVYQKSWSYAILFLRYMLHDGWNCYFSFSAIFCPFIPLTARKKKISKKKRTNKNYVPKTMIRSCTVSEIWCQQTYRGKKWHKRGGCPT